MEEYIEKFENDGIKYELIAKYKRFGLYQTNKGYKISLSNYDISKMKKKNEDGIATRTGKKYIEITSNGTYVIRIKGKDVGRYKDLNEAVVQRDKLLKEIEAIDNDL